MIHKLRKTLLIGASVLAIASTGALSNTANASSLIHNAGYKKHVISKVLKDTADTVGGYGKATTGGRKALPHTVSVNTTQQFRKALKSSKGKPLYIIVRGHLDGNVDSKTGKMMTTKQYEKGTGYSFARYAKMYNPIFYNAEPTGMQEIARKQAANRQKHNVEINVPSNVTIMGAPGSKLTNIDLVVHSHNDVLRNLNMTAPVDDFPSWDPQDGKNGNWNSEYDAISVKGGKDVWIDHDTMTDGKDTDSMPSSKTFNRQYQRHDGLTDITDKADDVTVSNNKFTKHDKVMLIGSSDNKISDKGRLHVTVEHNTFNDTVQRMPRVRYGHVNIKDNIFKNADHEPYRFSYAFGYGKDAHISADHNYFLGKNAKNIVYKHLIGGHQGKSMSVKNTYANGYEYTLKLKGGNLRNLKRNKHKAKLNSGLMTASKNNGATPVSSAKDHRIINRALKHHAKMPKSLAWLAYCLGI